MIRNGSQTSEESRLFDMALISALLRLMVAAFLITTGTNHLLYDFKGLIDYITYLYADRWFPQTAGMLGAMISPYIEISMGLALLLGFRLRLVWFLSGLLLVGLCSGLMMIERYGYAAEYAFFFVLCLAGLYVHRYDRFHPKRPS